MKKFSRYGLLATLLVLIVGCGGSGGSSFTAGTLHGSVFQDTTRGGGNPVSGVLVEAWVPKESPQNGWVGSQHGSETDSSGSYVIRGIPPGTYQINISTTGREAIFTAGLVTIADGEDVTKDIVIPGNISLTPMP